MDAIGPVDAQVVRYRRAEHVRVGILLPPVLGEQRIVVMEDNGLSSAVLDQTELRYVTGLEYDIATAVRRFRDVGDSCGVSYPAPQRAELERARLTRESGNQPATFAPGR